jgi:hypothetical protein
VETLEALPVAAALDRESLRELIMAAAGRDDGPWTAGERIVDAVWPLLEGAEYWHKRWTAALERADEDGMQAISQHVRIGEMERRAEAAEAKLAAIEARRSDIRRALEFAARNTVADEQAERYAEAWEALEPGGAGFDVAITGTEGSGDV